MLLDSAVLTLLASSAPGAVPNRPSINMAATPAQQAQAQAQALLMSPIPVLAHMMQQEVLNLAHAAQEGASSLLTLAGDADDMEVEMINDAGESNMGTSAMVGAAAMALVYMRNRAVGPAVAPGY